MQNLRGRGRGRGRGRRRRRGNKKGGGTFGFRIGEKAVEKKNKKEIQ